MSNTRFEFQPGMPVMAIYSPLEAPELYTEIKCFPDEQSAVDWDATHTAEHFTAYVKSVAAFNKLEFDLMFAGDVPYQNTFWIRRRMKEYRFSEDGQRIGV